MALLNLFQYLQLAPRNLQPYVWVQCYCGALHSRREAKAAVLRDWYRRADDALAARDSASLEHFVTMIRLTQASDDEPMPRTILLCALELGCELPVMAEYYTEDDAPHELVQQWQPHAAVLKKMGF